MLFVYLICDIDIKYGITGFLESRYSHGSEYVGCELLSSGSLCFCGSVKPL